MISAPLFTLILVLLYIEDVRPSIVLRNISVTPHPQVHQAVVLRCDYDLAGEPLYSLKWYKDNVEFYRWMPREVPPTRTFPVPGTEVSLSGSDHEAVKLRNLSLDSSGLYQCEVSTEAPKFKTVAADAVMSVVQPPSQGPRLVWLNSGLTQRARLEGRQEARPGDRIVLRCSSLGSVPAANLKFYINNEIANNRNVETVKALNIRDGLLRTSTKELDIVLERRHFRYGSLDIKCTSEIYDVYFQSAKMTFVGLDLGEMALGRQTISSGSSGFISVEQFLASISISLSFYIIIFH